MISRRERLTKSTTGTTFLFVGCLLAIQNACATPPSESDSSQRTRQAPNVILIMTDDQGVGDFGFLGNGVIHTPNLDRMAAASARLEQFYVSPVCTPTRAALMTGRAPQRTRAFDTYIGRAMLEPSEFTIAEALSAAGWATGIFGKWHLGDCYPMRAMDQGFDESLVHRGGGIGQPSDPEGGERKYTDAVLFHNGERVQTEGYCTDVYFDAGIEWIRQQAQAERPFFAYLATNAPHGPFHDVPEELYQSYLKRDLSTSAFPRVEGLPESHDVDRLARIFAMISNIDQNVGRLFEALEELDISEDTLVLFLVDNGPNSRRWVGQRRGMKSQVFEGGVRSPLLAHWPGRLEAGFGTDRVACHMDLMPTILDACQVAAPKDLDGRSVLPLLEGKDTAWPARAITIQAHRGDQAVRYHNFFTRDERWKLLNASGFGKTLESVEPSFELYDLSIDPLEQHNLAQSHPEVVARLRREYDLWFDSVSTTRPDNFAPPRIVLGNPKAPSVTLTRQDWRVLNTGGWGSPETQGQWAVSVEDAGPFDVRLRFLRDSEVNSATLWLDQASWQVDVPSGAKEITLEGLKLPVGDASLSVQLRGEEDVIGPYQVLLDHRGS